MQRPAYNTPDGKPLFSIIIPVYNVEKYLPACVKSVVEQAGAPDWECILVDDGSTDTCGSMCDAFAGAVYGVAALHQENAGLAAARNTGVAAATGTWVLYLDSDDKMAPEALENLRKILAQTNAAYNWYVCRYQELEDSDGTLSTPSNLHFTPGEYTAPDYALRVNKLYASSHWAVWKYCLRRSFLTEHKIEFWPDVLWAEDWPYDLLLLKYCDTLYFADMQLVYYRANRAGSLLNTGNLPRRFVGIVAAQRRFAKLFEAKSTRWTPTEQAAVYGVAADVFWPVARTAAVKDKAVRRVCAAGIDRCRPLYDCGSQWKGQTSWRLFHFMVKAFGGRFALWAAAHLHG